MNITNNEMIVILLIAIVIVFITNYDVYVVLKGEPICKQIKMIKRTIPLVPPLNKQEQKVKKETFKNLTSDGYFYKFKNMNPQQINLPILYDYKLPAKISYEKASVINSVIRLLTTIPTTLSNVDVKTLISFHTNIYMTASTIDEYIENLNNSQEILTDPYNTKYSKLIAYLIVQFNNIMMIKNSNLVGYNPKTQQPLFNNPNANIASVPSIPSVPIIANSSDYMNNIQEHTEKKINDDIESFNNGYMDDYGAF